MSDMEKGKTLKEITDNLVSIRDALRTCGPRGVRLAPRIAAIVHALDDYDAALEAVAEVMKEEPPPYLVLNGQFYAFVSEDGLDVPDESETLIVVPEDPEA